MATAAASKCLHRNTNSCRLIGRQSTCSRHRPVTYREVYFKEVGLQPTQELIGEITCPVSHHSCKNGLFQILKRKNMFELKFNLFISYNKGVRHHWRITQWITMAGQVQVAVGLRPVITCPPNMVFIRHSAAIMSIMVMQHLLYWTRPSFRLSPLDVYPAVDKEITSVFYIPAQCLQENLMVNIHHSNHLISCLVVS